MNDTTLLIALLSVAAETGDPLIDSNRKFRDLIAFVPLLFRPAVK